MRIFLTGASGLLGRRLGANLCGQGHQLLALTRGAARREGSLEWISGDPSLEGSWQSRVDGCDTLIHLAGESVGQRWTAAARARIRESRIASTRQVVAALQRAKRPPRVFICANGQDYYPFDESSKSYQESEGPGGSYLAQLCADWQSEAEEAKRLGIRVAVLRLGIVLAAEGGALPSMIRPFRFFAGGPLGSGSQWISWIHIEDLLEVVNRILENDRLSGPLNLVAPGALRQADFARILGTLLHRPSWLPTPTLALRLLLGEFSEHLIRGRRVSPRALLDQGFVFRYSEAEEALRAALQGD